MAGIRLSAAQSNLLKLVYNEPVQRASCERLRELLGDQAPFLEQYALGLTPKKLLRNDQDTGGYRMTDSGRMAVQQRFPELTGKSSVKREEDLYAPFLAAIKSYHAAVYPNEKCHFMDIAIRKKQGQWRNPDVFGARFPVYKMLNVRTPQISTYEIKKWGGWDLTSVYQTATHTEFAHRSFLVLEWSPEVVYEEAPPLFQIPQLESACSRFGVGLMTMEKW